MSCCCTDYSTADVSILPITHLLFRSAERVFHNDVCGYLFRSKTRGTNEGGLMSGTAALDTVTLCD